MLEPPRKKNLVQGCLFMSLGLFIYWLVCGAAWYVGLSIVSPILEVVASTESASLMF